MLKKGELSIGRVWRSSIFALRIVKYLKYWNGSNCRRHAPPLAVDATDLIGNFGPHWGQSGFVLLINLFSSRPSLLVKSFQGAELRRTEKKRCRRLTRRYTEKLETIIVLSYKKQVYGNNIYHHPAYIKNDCKACSISCQYNVVKISQVS